MEPDHHLLRAATEEVIGPAGRRWGWSGLLREKHYLYYLAGNTVSWIGTWAQRIGISWLSWSLTHRAVWVGAVSTATVLPLMVFGPLFGTLLDRHDHRRYALGVNASLALLALALYFLTTLHIMRIELLCVMAVFVGIANSAYQAVRLVMVNDVVARKHLAAAIAINSLLYNLIRAVGPAIAGVIIAGYGVAATFAANSVSYLGILIALCFVHLKSHERRGSSGGLISDSVAGLKYVRAHPTLRQLLLLSGVTSIMGRGVIELMPAFADGSFHRGSVGLADLTTAVGVGAVAGAAVLSVGWSLYAITRIATISVGGGVVLFGLCTAFPAALVMATVLGMAVVSCGVGLQVLLQLQVGAGYRGRVLGIWTAVNVSGPGLGGALIGLLSQFVGLKSAALCAGLACLVLVTLIRQRPLGPATA